MPDNVLFEAPFAPGRMEEILADSIERSVPVVPVVLRVRHRREAYD